MIGRLRDVWVVASFDFRESIRSKKALGLLLLAVIGSLSGAGMFLRMLHVAENELAMQLHVAKTEGTGAMATSVFHSDEFVRVLTEFTGDHALATSMSEVPPIAFFAGWLGLTFLPLLVILSSSDAVSAETSTGSVRFVLFRIDRLSWAIGKLGGQALLMTAGILAGGISAFAIGACFMTDFHPVLTGWWMLRLGGRVWIYGFAYLGLAVGVSLSVRSVNVTRGLGLVAMFAVGVIPRVLGHYADKAPVLLPQLRLLFPQAHVLDLWQPEIMNQMPSIVMLLALGTIYFCAGYARFARVDR